MAEKNNANISFEKQIWNAACVLWGHIPAADYRKVIIGLIFLRYISSAFDKRYKQLVDEGKALKMIPMYILRKISSLYRKKPVERKLPMLHIPLKSE